MNQWPAFEMKRIFSHNNNECVVTVGHMGVKGMELSEIFNLKEKENEEMKERDSCLGP